MDSHRRFLVVLAIVAVVGCAFVGGVLVGQNLPAPLAEHFEAGVADEAAISEVLEAPIPGESFTFFEEIPDEPDDLAVEPEEIRREIQISSAPMPGQPARSPSEMPGGVDTSDTEQYENHLRRLNRTAEVRTIERAPVVEEPTVRTLTRDTTEVATNEPSDNL